MRAMRSSEKYAAAENFDCYENLANAIIVFAYKEYRDALWRLKEAPDSSFLLEKKGDLEAFFRSDWYGVLTDVDPEIIIQGAERWVEAKAKRQERGRRKAKKLVEQLAKRQRGEVRKALKIALAAM